MHLIEGKRQKLLMKMEITSLPVCVRGGCFLLLSVSDEIPVKQLKAVVISF